MQKNTRYIIGKEKPSWRDRLSSLSVFSRIFIVLSVVLLVFGLCTLGALNGTGKSVSVAPANGDIQLAYSLSYEKDQTLAAVYVNVGAVYGETGADRTGETLQLRARYYNGVNWNNAFGSTVYVADIYATASSSSYKSNANYNWIALAENKNLTEELLRISVLSSGCAGVINEVAFIDAEGKPIAASVADAYCDGVTRDEVMRTLDAQGSFNASPSYRYNFSYAEEYILHSVNGIELGGEGNTQNVYNMSTDYNAFGILIYTISTWIFGKSTFGLRLPSFLAAFGLFILAFALGRKLLRDDRWGLAFAVLFLLGGGLFGLGMSGTPLAVGLFFAVLGIYFMYFFFADGIKGDRFAVGALPVLWSGLASAAAFAVSTMTGFVCLVSLLLFVGGLLRLYAHRSYLVAKAERTFDSAPSSAETSRKAAASAAANAAVADMIDVTNAAPAQKSRSSVAKDGAENEGDSPLDGEIARIDREYFAKLRVSVGWFGCGIAFALLLVVLAAIPAYSSFVRFYGGGSFFTTIGKGIAQCLVLSDVTPLSAAGAFTPWSWFISFRTALVYGSADGGAAVYALTNFVAAYAAAAAFVLCSVYLLIGARTRREEKGYKRILRAYVGLVVGMAATLLPWLFSPLASAAQSYPFCFFYFSFIVLALYILANGRGKGKALHAAGKSGKGAKADGRRFAWLLSVSGIAGTVLFMLLLIVFILGMPAVFGWNIGADAAARMFGWLPPVALLPAA